MDPLTARRARRWFRRSAIALGILAVALGSFVANYAEWLINSQDCTVGFDTSTVVPPADASPQSWLCGEHASPVGQVVWYGAYLISLLATVGLIVLAWRRWSWRVGIPALALVVLLPVVTARLLNLPSDDCTASVRATHPAWACERGP